jgi:hypothetical protein
MPRMERFALRSLYRDIRLSDCKVIVRCGDNLYPDRTRQKPKGHHEMATDTREIPFEEAAAIRRGRLFQLKMKRNRAARLDALETVRQRPDGLWQARVGGRMRGITVVAATQKQIEAMVNDHYNERMLAALPSINR